MKQNNNNRRARGRGPRKPHGMGGGQHKGQGYESGGQELRIRGNAYQVLEKYLQLARDAGAAGDRVAAENYLQHADHYYRVLSAMNDGQRPRMGGRELSVADVNVQNVSQGLSAALYSGPNPQGMDMQGDGMQGQNPGNQGGHQQGGQSQGGHRQGGHQQGGQHQHAHQQGGHQHGGQGQGGGNANQANGHGNSYGNYDRNDRGDSQPSYAAPNDPVRPEAPAMAEEQPDYPEELLPQPGAVPAAEAVAPDDAEDGVQRTLRAPRPRLRGQRRGGPRQGDARQSEGGQNDTPGSDSE